MANYKTSDFYYELPPELIAQQPARPRDHSRLLLLDKTTGQIEHRYFFNIIDSLQAGDILVLNNSKVFPARLLGQKEKTGGRIEIFLHQIKRDKLWECLVGGRARVGNRIILSPRLSAVLKEDQGDGTWLVEFNLGGADFFRAVNRIGLMPLPPYIKRSAQTPADKRHYQTVFADADKVGSAAAPTAGLHFTPSLLKKIKGKGVKIEFVTLHVGLGTFASVKEERIKDHKMHSEAVEISGPTWNQIVAAKASGCRIIAVGTTSCRALESAAANFGLKQVSPNESLSFWTDYFIYPGYRFLLVDALITNFHLPASSLLMLVSALAGKKNIDNAYKEAVLTRYRFFSFGDAMFIS